MKTTTEERSQEQIKYENMCLKMATGFYTEYLKHPQSVGAVCKWLQIFGLHEYDRVQVGFRNDIGTVSLFNRNIATFRFVDDMPYFQFAPGFLHLKDNQTLFHEGKKKYQNPFEL